MKTMDCVILLISIISFTSCGSDTSADEDPYLSAENATPVLPPLPHRPESFPVEVTAI